MNARWPVLSPLLDELLDLDPPARAARVQALRTEDAALADELQALLDQLPALDRDAFLERPALLPPTTLAGQTVGPYTVERELGEGGMGSVWLARRTDGRYEGLVAIKFLNAALMARGGAQRFAREGSILARLTHPNIARLLDAGVARDGAQPYLVLEYIDGQPIDRHCDEHRLDLQQRVRLFLDVLAAVAHAHNHLVLHRDLKPSNILVTAEGQVKLLDFGIAKLLGDAQSPGAATELTRQAGRAFTALYAAPEQLQGEDVTTATDVYALGVLLYLLLGGRHPTAAHSTTTAPLDQMRAVIELEPKRLSDTVAHSIRHDAAKLARELRGDLDNIVAKALKKAPGQRYANAAEFADDLRRYLNHEPVTARPDGAAYRVGKFLRRHRLGVAAGTLVAGALATGLGVALWQAREAQHQRVQAEGLIEFMLGDLRKKLQPVGRLDVLDAVGEKALAYYAAQDASNMNANAIGRKARALHLIGEIAEQRGRLEEASRVFERAAESTATLLALDPSNGQRIFDHSQSAYWVGYVAWRRGHLNQAEAEFRRYLDLAEQLVRLDPKNVDWRAERAYAGTNLGVTLLEAGEAAQAQRSFEKVRDTWLALVSQRPDLHISLANAWGWIAKARERLGDYAGAVEAQHAKRDALSRVPNATEDRDVDALLRTADLDLGRLQLALGRIDAAVAAGRQALRRYETLAARDPSNVVWQAETTIARLNLIESLLANGDEKLANEELQRAARDVSRLLSIDSAKPDWQVRLPGMVLMLSSRPGPTQAPIEEYNRYLATVQRIEAAGGQPDQEQTRIIAAVQTVVGDLLASRAPVEAQAHWRAVAERLRRHTERGEWPATTLLAHVLLRLGATSEARALATRIESSPYRHPTYADLRRRLAAAEGAAPAH